MSAAMPRGQRISPCPTPSTGPRHVDRWSLLQLVKDVRNEIGIGEREIAVLGAHLSVLPKGPLDRAALNISYMEAASILERANCMDERRFRRGEARLEEAGLVRRRLSANGRRFPVREGGKIVEAYGIDLNPLLQRLEELDMLREEARQRAEITRRLRTAVSSLLRDLGRTLVGASCRVLERLEELTAEMRRRLKRKTLTVTELEQMKREIESFEAPVTAGAVPQDAPSPALSPTAVTPSAPDRTADDAGQSVRRIESHQKEYKEEAVQPERGPLTRAGIARIWAGSRTLAEFYPDPPRDEHQLARQLFEFSSFIGLGQTTVTRAARTMGLEGLAVCLGYLADRIATISKPDGYLQVMLSRYEAGDIVAGGQLRRSLRPSPRSA